MTKTKTTIVAVAAMVVSAILAIGNRAGGQAIDIGGHKQLFIDHKFIESEQNISLNVNPPEKLPGSVLQSDKPWDAFRLVWFSVAKDQDNFKMWYQAYDGSQWNGGKSWMCYAESNDGVNWVKPDLGLVSYNGSTHNNILLAQNSIERSVFIDPHAPAAERYKMIGQIPDIRMSTSSDGIHWTEHSQVVWSNGYDTQKTAYWDANKNKYVVQVRAMLWGPDTTNPNDLPYPFVQPIASNPPVVAPTLYRRQRLLAQVEMDDIMQPWPNEDIRIMMCADENDPAYDNTYHPGGIYQYPYADNAYFMFPWMYHETSEDDTVDSQFAASRDGTHWMRYDRQPYIPVGGPGDPDEGTAQATGGFFRNGDNLYQYYMGWPWKHEYFKHLPPEQQNDPANWGKMFYGLVKQRLDGFVSADAPAEGGQLKTPTLLFTGDQLVLNIDASAAGAGALVGMLDADGNAIPGFSIADCDVIRTSDVDYLVTWNGESDISALSGRPIQLLFDMHSAKLYAFQFQVPEPSAVALLTVALLGLLSCAWRKRR